MPASRAASGPSKSTSCAVEPDLAGGPPLDRGDLAHEGRLAGAVVAHDRDVLALADLEVAVDQRVDAAVVLGQALGPQDDLAEPRVRMRRVLARDVGLDVACHAVLPYIRGRGAALAPLVEHDGADDDRALDHLLVVGVELQEGEAGDDDAEDQRAEHGAEDRAAAAREADAADHRHGDGVELVHHPHAGLRRQVLRREHDGGDRGEQAGDARRSSPCGGRP